MDYFKNTTGLSGATETGTPAKGSSAGAQASSTTYVDFSCANGAVPGRKTAGGYVFNVSSCQVTGTMVASVQLQMCSALTRGGSCADPSTFSSSVTLGSGNYATIDQVQVGLGCNDTNAACRLTVKSNYSMTTRTADIETTTRQQGVAQSSDGNNAQATITSMRTKTDANGNNVFDSSSDGTNMVDCASNNQKRVAQGLQPLTCDGKTAVDAGTTSTGNGTSDCSAAPKCIQEATKTTTFTRSCVRSYPMTSKICDMDVKTKQCIITFVDELDAKGKPTGKKLEQSTCTADDLKDGTKFGSHNDECVVSTPDSGDSGTSTCTLYNRTDYYRWAPTVSGTCFGDPYVPSGNCFTDDDHTDVQYTNGGQWFGRTRPDSECVVSIDGRQMPVEEGPGYEGCGVFTQPRIGYTCYAAQPLQRDSASLTQEDRNYMAEHDGKAPVESDDTCAAMDLTGCTLTGSEDVVADSGGIISSRKENYNCTKTQQSCIKYEKDPNCSNTTVSTYGLDSEGFRAGASDDAMNQALATAAVANALGGAVADGEGSTNVPLLFNGTAAHCDKPTGSWGSNGYYMDCCKISLERPGGKFGKLNKCSEEDARLAAARRANYTHYIGDYCSKKLPWPLKKCIRNTQGYCSFPGMLPRLIQEQGRKQLAEMASSGSSAQIAQAALNFNYYGTTGTWTPPVVANGVSVVAYQFPAYCKDLGQAEAILSKDPTAKECPTILQQYFATCDDPNGCGALPEYPELGAERWVLSVADPLQNVTTALSRFAVAKGSCDATSSQCTYQVSAWPAGKGGRAVVSKQFSFPVYVAAVSGQQPGAVLGEMTNIGDYFFRPYTTVVAAGTIPGSLPASVNVSFSSNGGQTWQTLSVPTADNTETSLGGTDAKLSGGCNANTNLCVFKMTGTATVTALSWGSAQSPNCSGFTAGQISVMDFGKMDFSEWIASVAGNQGGPNSAAMVQTAQSQSAKYNAAFQSGGSVQTTMAAPQGVQFARVIPSEGFGPFDVTVKVSGYWPFTTGDATKDTNPVTGVTVNWGDCTGVTGLDLVSQVNGQAARGFQGTHTYTRPQDVPKECGGGETNLSHAVTLTVFTAKSGTQTVSLSVKNAFNTMPGAYKSNTGNSVNYTPTNSATIPGQNTTKQPPSGP
jgi:hypothetical protein